MKTSRTFLLIAACAATVSAHAANLIDWNMSVLAGTRNDWPEQNGGASGNWSASWAGYTNPGYLMNGTTEATVLAGVIAGNMLGTNNNPGTGNYTPGLGYSTAGLTDGDLNLGGWSAGGGASGIRNWLYFTLQATAGGTLTIDGASITGWRNGGGAPDTWSFDYSTNGGTTWTSLAPTQTVTGTGGGSNSLKTFTASTPLVFDDTQTVTIRFDPYGTAAGTSGNIHIRSLTITGSVAAVPEPGTYGLLGAGALAGVAMIRRRRKAL